MTNRVSGFIAHTLIPITAHLALQVTLVGTSHTQATTHLPSAYQTPSIITQAADLQPLVLFTRILEQHNRQLEMQTSITPFTTSHDWLSHSPLTPNQRVGRKSKPARRSKRRDRTDDSQSDTQPHSQTQ